MHHPVCLVSPGQGVLQGKFHFLVLKQKDIPLSDSLVYNGIFCFPSSKICIGNYSSISASTTSRVKHSMFRLVMPRMVFSARPSPMRRMERHVAQCSNT